MKRLYYLRHSKKDGNVIGEEGLEYAETMTPIHDVRLSISHVFHGPVFRTCQTALAAVAGLGIRATVHPPVEEVGTDALFADLKAKCPKLGQLTNLEAVRDGLSTKEFEAVKQSAANGVRKMFDAMAFFNGVGVAFGHSPIIELAGEAFPPPDDFKLGELEGIVFVQDDETITVGGVRRIGDDIPAGHESA